MPKNILKTKKCPAILFWGNSWQNLQNANMYKLNIVSQNKIKLAYNN